ncbi:YbfB/YjiJ family MFS transporter [Lentzea sp. NPDC003310]|uniref:YbfB/YjiJ family MFS transporter n=1 Tax=Lentzea sp. NPDC003310 TaxID=3154447 RepID=UPI0033AEA0E6
MDDVHRHGRAAPPERPRPLVKLRAAAALAAAMGVGRFAYTPILPLMTAQAGLSPAAGASLATANYLGYFAGALATVVRPPSRLGWRVSLVLLVVTLVGMPLAHGVVAWFVLRAVAGVASAVVFVAAVNARPGWGMSGVGVGIALSGLLVLGWGQWQAAWWAAAVVCAVLAAVGWGLDAPGVSDLPGTIGVGTRRPLGAGESESVQGRRGHEQEWPGPGQERPGPGQNQRDPLQDQRDPHQGRRAFALLFTAYTLEGVGYIIAATFLVAAIPGPQGNTAWILVGASAALSPILLKPARHTLPAALAVQAAGIALPTLIDNTALPATLLFGGTFIGIAATALKQGTDLGIPNAAAILTAGYSAGQIAGPLLAAPLLHNGYHHALLLAAGIVALAAITAAAPLSRRRAAPRTPRRSRRAARAG